MPGKFMVLYFDDLNTSDADMIQVRDAADHYTAANLQPQDRVAIFTSEQMLSDFTSDPKEIHEALFKLHASARALDGPIIVRTCPTIKRSKSRKVQTTMLGRWRWMKQPTATWASSSQMAAPTRPF